MKNDELLHKWIEGSISEEELKEFKNRQEYEGLNEIFKETDAWHVPSFDSNRVLENILSSKQENPELSVSGKGRVISLNRYLKMAVAACILIIAGIFLFQDSGVQSFETISGQQFAGLLPDNSAYTLNANSFLEYNEKSWEEERNIILKGEAFFEVEKGSTFTVTTKLGKVQVLGTRFNVRSRDSSFYVSCEEGRVSVQLLSSNEQHILTAGKSCQSINSDTVELFDEDRVASWRTGISQFRNTPLNEVLKELEYQFEVTVEVNVDKPGRKITCNFQHDNLEQALITILTPLNLKFEITTSKQVRVFK